MFKKNEVSYKVDHCDEDGGSHAKQSIKYASEIGADLMVILTDDNDVSMKEFVFGSES